MFKYFDRINPCNTSNVGKRFPDALYYLYKKFYDGSCPCCAFFRGVGMGAFTVLVIVGLILWGSD